MNSKYSNQYRFTWLAIIVSVILTLFSFRIGDFVSSIIEMVVLSKYHDLSSPVCESFYCYAKQVIMLFIKAGISGVAAGAFVLWCTSKLFKKSNLKLVATIAICQAACMYLLSWAMTIYDHDIPLFPLTLGIIGALIGFGAHVAGALMVVGDWESNLKFNKLTYSTSDNIQEERASDHGEKRLLDAHSIMRKQAEKLCKATINFFTAATGELNLNEKEVNCFWMISVLLMCRTFIGSNKELHDFFESSYTQAALAAGNEFLSKEEVVNRYLVYKEALNLDIKLAKEHEESRIINSEPSKHLTALFYNLCVADGKDSEDMEIMLFNWMKKDFGALYLRWMDTCKRDWKIFTLQNREI